MSAELEDILSQQVREIIATQPTQSVQKMLQRVAENMSVQPIELAAALVFLGEATLQACRKTMDISVPVHAPEVLLVSAQAAVVEEDLKRQLAEQLAAALQIQEIQPEKNKLVRYRIEVGQYHQVSSEDIKSVLISESGVDRNQIGALEIRNTYSLIDLPSGMPPDIFQLLQTVEIKKQMLQIKRVNIVRKRTWQRRKFGSQGRFERCESSKGNR